jgi:hypothetical protein
MTAPGEASRGRSLPDWLALTPLLAVALWLRVRGLATLPPGLHFDEAAYGLLAEGVRTGHLRVFFSEFNGREPIYVYLVALAQQFLGDTILAERLPAALAGTATIATTYYAIRAIFAGQPNARRLAWLAALAVGVSFWSLHVSRQGERAGLVPLVSALAVGATWQAAQRPTRPRLIIAGFLGGLTLYTYLAARFLPLLAVVFAGYLLLHEYAAIRGARRSARRRHWRALVAAWRGPVGIWLGAALLTAAPLAIHFLLQPADLVERTDQVSALGNGGLLAIGRNLLDAARMLTIGGSGDLKYALPGRPIFDWLPGLLCYLGLAVCLLKIRRIPYAFLLCWCAVMFLPAILSTAGNHPLRAYGILPAIMGIWAVGADAAWGWLACRLSRSGHWAGLALVAALLALSGVSAYRDYFDRWAHDPRLYGAMDGEYADLAAYLRTLPNDGTPRVIAAETLDYPTIVYLDPDAYRYGWVDPSQALLIPAPARAGGRLEYIVPDRVVGTRGVSADWYAPLGVTPQVEPFRNAAGRILGKRYIFQLPPDFAPDRLQLLNRACGGVGAGFNGDLTLLGWQVPASTRPGETLPLTLFWEAQRPSRVPWQIFVHLVATPDAPRRWAQQDANGAFTRGLAPGDLVIGRYRLTLNPATPPGPALLQISLYDLDIPSYPRAPLLTPTCPTNPAHNTVILPAIQVLR